MYQKVMYSDIRINVFASLIMKQELHQLKQLLLPTPL